MFCYFFNIVTVYVVDSVPMISHAIKFLFSFCMCSVVFALLCFVGVFVCCLCVLLR